LSQKLKIFIALVTFQVLSQKRSFFQQAHISNLQQKIHSHFFMFSDLSVIGSVFLFQTGFEGFCHHFLISRPLHNFP